MAQNTIFDVYVNNVYATDSRSGVLLWGKKVQPRPFIPPALIGQVLYLPTESGNNVIALDQKTGEQKWSSETVRLGFSTIVEYNHLGYVISNDGRLRAFNLGTGAQTGVLDTGAGLPFGTYEIYALPSLVVEGKTLIFSFGDAYLFGFQTQEP